MKKPAFISLVSLFLSACGGGDTVSPTPTMSITPLATVHPRCFMDPRDRPRPEEGIICPGGATIPSPSSRVSTTPTLAFTPTGSSSPVPSTTAHDTSCLTGVWLQNAAEITCQMRQLISTMSPSAVSGDIQFKFFPDKSFTEHVNNLNIQFERRNPLNSTPDRHEMHMNGEASGRIEFDPEGNLVITGVSLSGVTSTYTINGENVLVGGEMSLGGLIPPTNTKIGVSCGSGFMTLSYLIPGRPTTIRLIRQ